MTARYDARDHRHIEPGAPSPHRRWLYWIALVVMLTGGIVLGVWHLIEIAGRALFVFRSDEPLTSWVIIAAGPLTTLPATALATIRRRWGASWLIGGGLISLGSVVVDQIIKGESIAAIASAGYRHSVLISLPMVLLGVGLLSLEHWLARTGR